MVSIHSLLCVRVDFGNSEMGFSDPLQALYSHEIDKRQRTSESIIDRDWVWVQVSQEIGDPDKWCPYI